MKQINFETSNYSHKEELKTFLSSFNELMDKFNKSLVNSGSQLSRINAEIGRKKASVEKLDLQADELVKREEELKSLKALTTSDIKTLEARKKTIDYTDSEVQKMEREDIDVLINSKKNKINKIEAKLESTKAKITQNKDAKKANNAEMKNLETQKKLEEENQFRTQNVLRIVIDEKEKLNNDIYNALMGPYNVSRVEREEEIKEEKPERIILESKEVKPVIPSIEEDTQEIIEDVITEDEDYSLDFDNVDVPVEEDIEEPTLDIEPIVEEIQKQEEEKIVEESETPEATSELSLLDFDAIELPEEALPNSEPREQDNLDRRKMVEETFQKEGIDYQLFDEPTQIKLVENADRVLKNIIVLKKHQIPLELTVKQPKIYYNITPQDLEDLLNIITVDEDGNGMGFTIDFVFYVLDELSLVDVDKLIEVYNNEFMNVNSKSGLIKLLRIANENLGDFATNRKANVDSLKSLGVNNTDSIEREYKDFVDLDNPLFLSALNLFDKNDLVAKINADIKIIPRIVEYWKNN